jgi:predicted dinucleotide-binding enzyme
LIGIYQHTVGILGDGERSEAIATLLRGGGVTTVRFGRSGSARLPEIVVLAAPWSEVAALLADVVDWEGRILIDATNAVANGTGPGEEAASSSEVVARLAAGAHVVKSLNALPAARASGPKPVGDHRRAKEEVARLLRHLGFAVIDLGSLAEGARLQAPGGPLFGPELVQVK